MKHYNFGKKRTMIRLQVNCTGYEETFGRLMKGLWVDRYWI